MLGPILLANPSYAYMRYGMEQKNAQNSVLILLPFSWKLLFLYFFFVFRFFWYFFALDLNN